MAFHDGATLTQSLTQALRQLFQTFCICSSFVFICKCQFRDCAFVHLFSRVLRDSTSRYVDPSVGRSVSPSPFWAGAPEGSMTYGSTQGNFSDLMSVSTPPPRSPKSGLSDLKAGLSDLKSGLSDPKSGLSDPKSGFSDPKSGLSDLKAGL